jgi:hypothetical protein
LGIPVILLPSKLSIRGKKAEGKSNKIKDRSNTIVRN